MVGVAGLTVEIVWCRMLALTLGASSYATSTVLASFMGGLALGSYIWSRKLSPTPTLLRNYALLVLGFSITSVLVTILIPLVGKVQVYLAPSITEANALFFVIRFALSFFLLLIPTMFWGGTLPILVQYITKTNTELGKKVGTLYFLNTLGSVLGALVAGFWFLEHLGLNRTVLLIAALNLIPGLVLAKKGSTVSVSIPKATPTTSRKSFSPRYGAFGFLFYGVSGFAALSYQVIWNRALATYLVNTTYTFVLILVPFLLGLALGSLIATKFTDKLKHPFLGFGLVEAGIGISAIIVLAFLGRAPEILAKLMPLGRTWLTFISITGIFIFGAVVIPTLFMGATLPLITRSIANSTSVGKNVGLLYAFNTIGGILGSVMTCFVFLPLLGTSGTTILNASLNILVAMGAVILAKVVWQKKFFICALISVVAILIFLKTNPAQVRILPTDVAQNLQENRVLFYKESSSGTVTTAEDWRGVRHTWVNSSPVCGSIYSSLKTVRLLGMLPFVYLDEIPKDVCIIGYGIGVTTAIVAQYPVRQIDCVEITPAVIDASRFFRRVNHQVYSNPKVRLIAEDGRNFLFRSHKQYSVISCDPTHPVLGSSALYTYEFFKLCRAKLVDGGLMLIYMPFHLLAPEDFRTIVNTFRTVFPECALWRGHSHGILVGRRGGTLQINFELLSSRLVQAQYQNDLNEVNLSTPYNFLSCFFLDKSSIAKFTTGAGLFFDDQPRIEFSSARSRSTETWLENSSTLLHFRSSVLPSIKNLPDTLVRGKIQLFHLSEEYKIQGIIYKMSNRFAEAKKQYEQALRINPFDPEIPYLLSQINP